MTNRERAQLCIVLGMAVLTLFGCGSDPCGRAKCEPLEPSWIDPSAEAHHWVVNSVRFPTSRGESNELGFDLDADPSCSPDNTIGFVLSFVSDWLRADVNEIISALIVNGRILHLLEVTASSLEEATGAGVTLRVGIDADGDPSNNLSGKGTFEVDNRFPSIALAGQVEQGRLTAALGSVPLQIALSDTAEPVVLTLNTAVAELIFDGDTVRGRIGGAFTKEQVDDELVPMVWAVFSDIVAADCMLGLCAAGSRGQQIVDWFDSDDDQLLSLEEFQRNPIITSITSAVLDLFDGEERHNPGCDGKLDSLGFGFSFTAVPATFQ